MILIGAVWKSSVGQKQVKQYNQSTRHNFSLITNACEESDDDTHDGVGDDDVSDLEGVAPTP